MEARGAEIALLVALNLWAAYRYAKQLIGVDEGTWLMWGFMGTEPFREVADCKPPGIGLWMWILAHLTGRRLFATKFLHHATMGAIVVGVYLFTGSLGAGLMATALLQSAWMYSFQSWLDAISGGFLLLALVAPPWLTLLFVGLAFFFNLKTVPSGAAIMLLRGEWLQIGVGAAVGVMALGVFFLLWPDLLKRIWFWSVTVGNRMRKFRYKEWEPDWVTWPPHFAHHLMILIPALAIALYYSQDIALWGAVVAYVAFNAWGGVWRPNHSLPLAMIAAASPTPALGALILLMDWAPARLLLGNVWAVCYPGIANVLICAKEVGDIVKELPGKLFVNTYHSEIYIHAGQRSLYPFVTPEKAFHDAVDPDLKTFRDALTKNPPDIIVIGPGSIAGDAAGYQVLRKIGPFRILV